MTYRLIYNNGSPIVEERVKKKFLGISYYTWKISISGKYEDAIQAFQANLAPHKFDVDKHVEHAFTYQGVDYYQYQEPLNMTPVRFGYFSFFMNESSMNCNRDFLLLYLDNVEKALNEGSLVKVAQLSKEMKDRLKLAFIPDLIYKVASVMYFDKNEDPQSYDYKYNQGKIKKWKEAGSAFFLETPVKDLTLSHAISEKNLPTYLMILNKLDKEGTRSLLENISENMSSQKLQSYNELLSLVNNP